MLLHLVDDKDVALARIRAHLHPGDILVSSTKCIGDDGKLKALTDAWADTTTPTGKLILTVLGGLAEFERSLIAERTAEGRERARRAGRRLGRPHMLTTYQRDVVLKMRAEGQDNAEIARVLGVSRSTVSRIK